MKKNFLKNSSTLTKPSNDELFHNRNMGTFNDMHRPLRDDMQWRSCVQRVENYHQKAKLNLEAELQRGTRRVQSAYKTRDPILQTGQEIQEVNTNRNPRQEIKPSVEYTTMMNKKVGIHGKSVQTTRKEKINYESVNTGRERDVLGSKHQRLVKDFNDVKIKHSGTELGNLINYGFAPKFRDHNVSQKPVNIPLSRIESCKKENARDIYYGKRPTDLTRHHYPNIRDL